MRSVSASPATLWKTINRIRITLGLSDEQLADFMMLTPKDLLHQRTQNKDVSVHSAFALADRLHIGAESLLTGQIDYRALAIHYGGDTHILPERYLKDAKSKVRSAKAFLNFFETHYGWQSRAAMLRQFQVHESAIANDDASISSRFAIDLCEHLYRYSGSTIPVFEMGRHSILNYIHTPAATVLRNQVNLQTAYELVFSEFVEKFIEKNVLWQVESISATGCVVCGSIHPDSADPEHSHHPLMCVMRGGFGAALPAFLGLPDAQVKKTGCVFQGDPCCRYEVTFPNILRRQQRVLPFRKSRSDGDVYMN